jgi:hypothetical protein
MIGQPGRFMIELMIAYMIGSAEVQPRRPLPSKVVQDLSQTRHLSTGPY